MTCSPDKRRLKSLPVHCGNRSSSSSSSSSSALRFYDSWPPWCYVTATVTYSAVSTLEFISGTVTTIAAGKWLHWKKMLDTLCTSWWLLLVDNYHKRRELAEKNSFVSVWLWNMKKERWIKMVTRFQVCRDCILLLIENEVKFTSATLFDYCIKSYLRVHYAYTYIIW